MAGKDKGTDKDWTPANDLGLGDWMKQVSAFWSTALGDARSVDNAEAMDRLKAMQGDMLAFVDRRVEKDMEAVRRMGEARTPADVGKLQLEYLQDLMVDYNRQAMKVAEETAKAMTSLVQRLPKGL